VAIQPQAGRPLLPRIKVNGAPEERLKEAFKPTARFVIPEHQILPRLIDEIDTRNDTESLSHAFSWPGKITASNCQVWWVSFSGLLLLMDD